MIEGFKRARTNINQNRADCPWTPVYRIEQKEIDKDGSLIRTRVYDFEDKKTAKICETLL